MRNILFRGKRLDNGKWVEGSYMEHYYSSRFGCVSAIFTNDDVLCKTHRIPVDPTTVGQYTGLTDKNGVKIFEGDLLRGKGKRVFRVDYIDNIACFAAHALDNGLSAPGMTIGTMQFYEVIGNVHDNPEILGGGSHD